MDPRRFPFFAFKSLPEIRLIALRIPLTHSSVSLGVLQRKCLATFLAASLISNIVESSSNIRTERISARGIFPRSSPNRS